jgi:aerobic-type carbon monoxide dehydrogenase small subunit (CoxS/CutS family)
MLSAAKDNNHLTIGDIVKHFEANKIKITHVVLLKHSVIKAHSALALKIAGKDVGIYKYDTNIRKQEKKLQWIKEHGYVFLCGIKYPAMINGSFVMIEHEKNPEKDKIIKAFKSFSTYK